MGKKQKSNIIASNMTILQSQVHLFSLFERMGEDMQFIEEASLSLHLFQDNVSRASPPYAVEA